MDRTEAAGVSLTALAAVGYAVGVVAPYPFRSLTVTGVIVGLTLWAVGS